jgi:hypothetical protein
MDDKEQRDIALPRVAAFAHGRTHRQRRPGPTFCEGNGRKFVASHCSLAGRLIVPVVRAIRCVQLRTVRLAGAGVPASLVADRLRERPAPGNADSLSGNWLECRELATKDRRDLRPSARRDLFDRAPAESELVPRAGLLDVDMPNVVERVGWEVSPNEVPDPRGGLHPETLVKMARAGRCKGAVKVGREWRFPSESVEILPPAPGGAPGSSRVRSRPRRPPETRSGFGCGDPWPSLACARG